MSALALAVAMAAPAVRGAFGETAASPLVVDPAAAEARAASSDGEVLLAQAQTGSAADTLKQGVNQYKSGNYEDAVATLQSIDASTLSDKDRKTLNDALTKAGAAADQRRAARAEFEQGQADLNDNKPGSAITHFQNAAENKYADKGTQNKAREQIALAETMRKGMAADMKKLYSQAVASYKAGDLAGARTSFRQLVDMGYKAGAFQKSPQDFIKDINKKIGAEAPAAPQAEATPAAPVEATPAPAPVADSAVAQATPTAPAPSEAPAPAPAETPAATAAPAPESAPAAEAAAPAAEATATVTAADARRAYLRGRDQYRKGDWINARKNLEIAQQAGYKPGLFEDKPSVILGRMDRKEQADAARAAKRAEAMAAADAARQPAAQATEAAPTAVAQAAPSEPAAPTATAAPAEPAPAQPATPATPQQELQSTAQLDKIRAEQGAAEARQLVEQARAAQQASRYAEALDLYSRAQQRDPNNAEAAAGAREMAAMAGRGAGGTNLLQRQAEAANVARGEITYTIDTELNNATQAAKSGDFNRAREALNRARSATQINPQVFTEQENRAFLNRIDQTQVAVNTAETDFRARTQAEEQAKINNEIEQQRKNEAEARTRTVRDLIENSKRLVNETRYSEALGVIDQILVLDPTNDYASGIRPLVEDKAHLQDQRRSREEHDRQLTKQLNAAEEAKIPYNDILRYPVNWPDISELRDQTTATELGGTPADQATQLLLERRLPELKLDNIPFTDVIDALRDLTNANIFVNWRALESEGVDRAAPVTARLRDVKFAKALDTILKDVGGGTVNLGYTIDDGVITISTQTDLAKNTLTRVYDIRDLIVEIPDFADAPQFQLQQSNTTSGRGGGGGGSQSLFGQNNEQGQGEGDRAALITEIQELIQETVDPESWREAGGSVGSIRVLGGNLIVNQTPENHRALQGLLEQLRESQSIQITIEARFLTVQRNFLEDIGVDVDFIFNSDADANDKWSPIPVNNNSAVFTANPITGIPGSIGNVAPSSVDPEDPLSVGVGALGLSGTYLDNFAVTFLVRATQALQNSTVVTAPRVTLSNGQRGYVVVSTQTAYVSDLEPVVGTRSVGFDPTISIIESGILLDVQGTVSADRKYVTLTLRPTLSRLAALQPFTVQSAAQTTGGDDDNTNPVDTGIATATLQQPIVERTLVRTTVTVPDGGTLLLGGQTLAGEVEREAGVPVLSKIPFLKRLFTNRSMAKDEQVLLILVKPTIIIAKEQERKQFPVLSTRVGG
jgi:general secretion pathway protein D